MESTTGGKGGVPAASARVRASAPVAHGSIEDLYERNLYVASCFNEVAGTERQGKEMAVQLARRFRTAAQSTYVDMDLLYAISREVREVEEADRMLDALSSGTGEVGSNDDVSLHDSLQQSMDALKASLGEYRRRYSSYLAQTNSSNAARGDSSMKWLLYILGPICAIYLLAMCSAAL